MSRSGLLIVSILCLSIPLNVGSAQGWYVAPFIGYRLGAGTQAVGENSTTSGTSTSYEGVYGSLGEGFGFGASVGYLGSSSLGVELGLAYWLGNSFETTSSYYGSTETDKVSGTGFMATPSIVVAVDLHSVKPYARLGLVFGIMKVTAEMSMTYNGQTTSRTAEETGGLGFGYAGGFGIIVPLGGSVDFFTEAALFAVTYSPGQAELTKYTVNGADQLASVTNKVVTYKDSYNSTEQNTSLAVRRPFSNIGINAGIRINL